MTISMLRTKIEDAAEMAPRMRKADVEEVASSGGYTPLAALEDAIYMSKGFVWTTRLDGEILGIWGVVTTSVLTGEAIPWLLTTDLVDRHPKVFYRLCCAMTKMLRRKYGLLTNRIDQRHEQALRWARRLGFELSEEAESFGRDGRPFIRITMRGERNV